MAESDGWWTLALQGLPKRRKYLVAVSGGLDSVVLFHGLRLAGFRKLVLCHLDHGLRGAQSEGDARFVRRLAQEAGLPVRVKKVAVASLAQEEGLSLEEAGRKARHAFFREVARAERCHRVLLAHHAGDQAETLLLNLCRGTGWRGLAGMSASKLLEDEEPRLELGRPLLKVSKAQLREFAEEQGISWREDESNAEQAFSRNALRHEILPRLNRVFAREVAPLLLRASDQLTRLREFVDEQVSQAQTRCGDRQGIRLAALLGEAPFLQGEVLRAWLKQEGIEDLSQAQIEASLLLAKSKGSPAKINLAAGRHLRRRAGCLFLE
ncbi:MAG: tRNA lysidine(34) synthetase TilS [Verrucomicrobiota bacterium]